MGLLDAPPRPINSRNASIWALGDSITANGYTAPAGTVSHLFYNQSYLMWTCLHSLGRLRFGGIAATGGYTTAQIISTHLPTVVAAKPAYCVVHAGTNDNGTLTLAQSIANLKTIFDSLLAAGIVPVATTMLPKQTLLNGSRLFLESQSLWVLRYATTRNFPAVDITSAMINPANGGWPGYSGGVGTYNVDDTHPNGLGAKTMGSAIWSVLSSWVPPRPSFFPAYNTAGSTGGASYYFPTLDNALHLTDTNSDGLPDRYSGSTGATIAYSITAMAGNEGLGNWFNVTQNGAGANPFPQGIGSSFVPGNQFLLTCKVKTTGIVSSGGQWHIRLTDSNTADILALRNMNQDLTLGGLIIEFKMPATITSTSQLRFVPYLDNLTSGSATLSVGQVGIYDLTAMGIA